MLLIGRQFSLDVSRLDAPVLSLYVGASCQVSAAKQRDPPSYRRNVPSRIRANSLPRVSPCAADRKRRPTHVQLLERMSSTTGTAQNLLLGVFEPACGFDSELNFESRHNDRSGERNAGGTSEQWKTLWKSFPDKCYSSEANNPNDSRLMSQLFCDSQLDRVGAHRSALQQTDWIMKATDQQASTSIADVKDLEMQVSRIQTQHCKK